MGRKYTKETLVMAVNAVREAGLSVNAASIEYGVPYGTLYRRVSGEVDESVFARGPKPALGSAVEDELKQCIIELLEMGHGLTRAEILELAGKVDAKSAQPIFKQGIPSNRWYQRFMCRHKLSLRTPENLSVARIQMATFEVRDEFFSTLSSKVAELKVDGTQIYNMDESGMQLVMKSKKVVAAKGSKSVFITKSGERSENITVVACANASGSVILPPMVIFRGGSLNEQLMEAAPEGTIFGSSPKGYMITELFFDWFVKFLQLIPPKRPVLLLLDGHATHMSREVLILARANGVTFLCFPPHTTQLYQPLDVGLFKSLKDSFREECDKRMRRTQKLKLNRYDFCKVLGPAWLKAANMSNIVGGFRGSGCWPINKDAVRTDRLVGSHGATVPSTEPSTSGGNDDNAERISPVVTTIRELFTPIPVGPTDGKKSRAITKTRCLTSDDYLEEIAAKQKAKDVKEQLRTAKASNKRKHFEMEEEEDDVDGDLMEFGSSEGEEENEDEDTATEGGHVPCGTCNKRFSADCHGENWFRCCNIKCSVWYHLTCQNFPNNSKRKSIVCLKCKSLKK